MLHVAVVNIDLRYAVKIHKYRMFLAPTLSSFKVYKFPLLHTVIDQHCFRTFPQPKDLRV